MADTGVRPTFALEAFGDLEGGRAARIQASPSCPAVRGSADRATILADGIVAEEHNDSDNLDD